MNRGALYLAVYDISVDRERNRVADILEGYGVRLQKSAFEVRLDRTGRSRLMHALEALDLSSGWVVLYRVDENARRHHAGIVPPNPFAEDQHAYVV